MKQTKGIPLKLKFPKGVGDELRKRVIK